MGVLAEVATSYVSDWEYHERSSGPGPGPQMRAIKFMVDRLIGQSHHDGFVNGGSNCLMRTAFWWARMVAEERRAVAAIKPKRWTYSGSPAARIPSIRRRVSSERLKNSFAARQVREKSGLL